MEAGGPAFCSVWTPGFCSQPHLAKCSHLIHVSKVQSQGSQKHGAAMGRGENNQEFQAACFPRIAALTKQSERAKAICLVWHFPLQERLYRNHA